MKHTVKTIKILILHLFSCENTPLLYRWLLCIQLQKSELPCRRLRYKKGIYSRAREQDEYCIYSRAKE